MEEEQFAVPSEQGLVIIGTIFRPKPRGVFPLVVLAPDFFDTADSPYVKEMAKQLLEANIAVVRFDFTNGFGKSEGRGEDTTISQRARDLQQVIEYARRRAYVNDKKIGVIGFGFSAMASLVLESFQQTAKALTLINTPHAIDATTWTRFDEREMMRVKLKRYFHVILDGKEIRVNYTLFEDALRTDMSRCARNLKTPTLYLTTASTVFSAESSTWLSERTSGVNELAHLSLPDATSKKAITEIVTRTLAFFKKQKTI